MHIIMKTLIFIKRINIYYKNFVKTISQEYPHWRYYHRYLYYINKNFDY